MDPEFNFTPTTCSFKGVKLPRQKKRRRLLIYILGNPVWTDRVRVVGAKRLAGMQCTYSMIQTESSRVLAPSLLFIH